MTATIALLRPPHSDWLARIRTIQLGLGGRGVLGLGVGRSAVSAAAETPYTIAFNGSTTQIERANTASLQDISATASMTVEGWFFTSATTANQRFVVKGQVGGANTGWGLWSLSSQLYFTMFRTTGAVSAVAGAGTVPATWWHWAVTFDVSTGAMRHWINGTATGSAATFSGTYKGDSTQTLYIGRDTGGNYLTGAVGWVRVSNIVRYSSNFTPAPKCTPPATDANTLLLYRLTEGAGTVIADSSANTNTGTLANGTWSACS